MELKSYAGPQASTSLSLGQALRELPGQYIKVLTRPSPTTFRQEGRAGWGINWVQMIGLAILSAALQTLGLLISPPALTGLLGASGMSAAALLTTSIVFLAIFTLILTPVSFLAAGGIVFLIVKAFGGKGTYLQQIYTTLLFGVPLVLLSDLFFLIPGVGYWLPFVPHIYSLVLFIIALRAVHWRR
jgi:hypothetical protein